MVVVELFWTLVHNSCSQTIITLESAGKDGDFVGVDSVLHPYTVTRGKGVQGMFPEVGPQHH